MCTVSYLKFWIFILKSQMLWSAFIKPSCARSKPGPDRAHLTAPIRCSIRAPIRTVCPLSPATLLPQFWAALKSKPAEFAFVLFRRLKRSPTNPRLSYNRPDYLVHLPHVELLWASSDSLICLLLCFFRSQWSRGSCLLKIIGRALFWYSNVPYRGFFRCISLWDSHTGDDDDDDLGHCVDIKVH